MATYYWVGGTGTWNNSNTANWSNASGGASGFGPPLSTDTVIFDASSGTGTCTTASGSACATATLNSSTLALTLGADHTMSGTFTLTLGALDLGNNKLTCNIFNTNNTNTRSIAFGTGNITLTGNATTIWTQSSGAGFTYTGTPTINCTYSGTTGTRTISTGSGLPGTAAMNFNITAGTDTISVLYVANNLDFTGFSGTWTMLALANLHGNLTLSSTMTAPVSTNLLSFIGASKTQQITSAGKTIDCPVAINGSGTILQLQDNMTVGSTRTFTITTGTLDLTGNSGNWTLSTGLFNANNSSTRAITFGTGNITLTGSGTVWNTGTVTNFSYTGTPTINVSNNSATATTVTTGAMTAAQALNFNYTVGTYTLTDTSAVYKNVDFTGFTGTLGNAARTIYGNMTVVAGMTMTAGANATTFAATSGTQQITTNAQTLDFPLTFNGIGGTFAFQDALTQGSTRAFTITNGTVQLKAGVTSTVGSLATSGTNQKTLQSTLAGTQATLSQASGNANLQYLTVKDIAATGGAKFNALNNCITQGNNSGWYFAPQLGRPLPSFAF